MGARGNLWIFPRGVRYMLTLTNGNVEYGRFIDARTDDNGRGIAVQLDDTTETWINWDHVISWMRAPNQ